MLRRRLALPLLALLSLAVPAVRAEPIVAGSTSLYGRAIQDVTLLANTPFNPTGQDIVIDDLFGDGVIVIHRDAQVGAVINIASISGGTYYGSHAILGDYAFGNIPPLTGADFSGSIADVVQNPADPGYATGAASSFQSGDFTVGGASFGFLFLTGPAAGLSLFTDPSTGFQFSATFDGLPPSAGTTLMNSGPAVLDVLFNGQVVARSSDRRIVLRAVPEPMSLAMLACGASALGALLRNRKRS